MTANWSTEAREAVALCLPGWPPTANLELADRVLAALAPHVQPRTNDWEWGVKWDDEEHFVPKPTEAHARAYAGEKCIHGGPVIVVRRRPGCSAGEWEVAP